MAKTTTNTTTEEPTLCEYLVAQLHMPVLTQKKNEKTGDMETMNATDPRDGHELTAKEAIAMKLVQNALNGDIKAAQFVMEQERIARQLAMLKNRK